MLKRWIISIVKITEHWQKPMEEANLTIIEWKDLYNVHTTQSNPHPNTNIILQRKCYAKIHLKPQQILSSMAITCRKNKAGAITASDVKTEHKTTVTKEVIRNIYTRTLGGRNESTHLLLTDFGSKCQKQPFGSHFDH